MEVCDAETEAHAQKNKALRFWILSTSKAAQIYKRRETQAGQNYKKSIFEGIILAWLKNI